MRSAVVLILVMSAALAVGACSEPQRPRVIEGLAQGTSYSVQWWDGDRTDPAALGAAVAAELARIDRVLSNYRPDSDIERFNAVESLEPQAVVPEIAELARTAAGVSRASAGCYDPTVKPLFDLWGFSGETLHRPTPDETAGVLARVGMERLRILDDGRLAKGVAGLSLDLSSIAQGYTVARMAGVLEGMGIRDYLVELGGELTARGLKPGGLPWRVAVERPLPGERRVQRVVTLPGEPALAVMTSGTYRHFFDADGTRYSHILDPRTGAPVTHATASVTVFHEDPTLADAWSTALLCLGAEAGLPVADREGLRALFIEVRGGEILERRSRALTEDGRLRVE